MMNNLDCFALMLGDESQAACRSSAISSEEVVIVSSPLVPKDQGVWRCLAVEKLSQVELRTGTWHTESRSPRQTCIDEIDFDADAQPEEDPQ
jgi:hypothetical protein